MLNNNYIKTVKLNSKLILRYIKNNQLIFDFNYKNYIKCIKIYFLIQTKFKLQNKYQFSKYFGFFL